MSEIRLKTRARELGLLMPGRPGMHNAITDVGGVLVGYETLSSLDNPALAVNGLPVQTGVTAILPRGHERTPRPIWAGLHALNGNGEMTGSHWIRDGGYFVGPVLVTNTHGVGAAHEGAVRWMIETYRAEWENNHLWAMPVVAETYDGVLNDINGLHVRPEHAIRALANASGSPPAEGNVGGGAGMICYEFKGGTGTASRLLDIEGATYTVGVLVQANHGLRPWLRVLGCPVGDLMTEDRIPGFKAERGSIIVVIATDLPLLSSQLDRLARRATIGLGLGGTPGGNGSGDIFLAFSTANTMLLPQFSGPWKTLRSLNDERLDPVYLAAVEAVEEAVLNAMLAAEDMPTARPAGSICRAIDAAALKAIVHRRGARSS